MKKHFVRVLSACCFLAVLTETGFQPACAYTADFGANFRPHTVRTDSGEISGEVGGSGPAIILLHGYAEDSRMWKPLAKKLSKHFTVIAPDLPGIGNSSIPTGPIDMVAAAKSIHEFVRSLGVSKTAVAGHDIGLMVAYAYAASYRSEVTKLALMDAFLPGVSGWEPIYNDPYEWHFRFFGATPVALVSGRERTYFEHFWNDFAADRHHSLNENERREYTLAYSRPGRMAAGFAYFASFQSTARAFHEFAKTKLGVPVLSLGGDHSLGDALGRQCRLIASSVRVVVVPNAGHWLMEEQPSETMSALINFFST